MSRIAWYSNACHIPSGYGMQTAQVVHRLIKAGHEVAVSANHGAQVLMNCAHGHPIFPEGIMRHSIDSAPDTMNAWMNNAPGAFGVILFDLWPLVGVDGFKEMNLACWVPIDHAPAPPQVFKFLKDGGHHAIAMSKFGEEMLLAAGQPRDELTYIPHAIDRSVFRDTGKESRKRLGIPDEAFLVTTVAANRGRVPVRKGFGEMADAMAMFMKDRPDVMWLIHTEQFGFAEGVNLPRLLAAVGIDPDRVRYPHPVQFRNGIPDASLADIYSASDAHLLLSMGEGFGIPVVEALSCGVPNIVSDASAQRELVGVHSKKVKVQRTWDEYQTSWFVIANIEAAYAALQELYEETRAGKIDRVVIAAEMARYDADTVFEESWLPLVERMSARKRPSAPALNRAQRRASKNK